MSNKTDLQENNIILGDTPAGLLGGLNKVKRALVDKGFVVEQVGNNPTFTELENAIDNYLPEQTENLDVELTEQETAITELENTVNALSEIL